MTTAMVPGGTERWCQWTQRYMTVASISVCMYIQILILWV